MIFGSIRLDFHTVGSALDIAREQAERGAPHGALITASHQTAGRGRRGATWSDEPGRSALLAYIARVDGWRAEDLWRAPFAVSLACVRALHAERFDDARVEWPNDLSIDGGKVGGILIEAPGGAGAGRCLLIGIGINVEQGSFDAAADYPSRPVSLRIAAQARGRSTWPSSVEIAAAVSAQLDRAWSALESSPESIVADWRPYQRTGQIQRGIDIAVGEPVEGAYVDVRESDGAALLEVPGRAALVAALASGRNP